MRTSQSSPAFFIDHSRRFPGGAPWLYALLAVLLVVAGELVVEHFAYRSESELEKNSVLHRLSALRARLEGVVNANLFLVHGLTAVIAAQPDIDQIGFTAIARGLVDERHALRNIGGAPGMVVSLMYPLAGNEAVLGLDYRTNPAQREAALRARDSGRPVVAGPLQLQQGGVGIIVREPVYLDAVAVGGERPFWGLVSAVIDVETLYRLAGLYDPDLGLRVALRGTDGTGPQGAVFYGDPGLFDADPVTVAVTLPGGSWHLAAIPRVGWGRADRGIDLIRLMGLLTALVVGIMVYRLVHGAEALGRQSAHLRALLDTIPDPIWLKDPVGRYLACNRGLEALFGRSEAAILGGTDRDFVSAELAEHFRAKDLAAIAAGGPSINEEWVTFASDGRRVLLETIKAPVAGVGGRLLGVLGIARDITGRMQAEIDLRRQMDLLDHTGRLAHVGGWRIDVATMQGSFTDEMVRIHGLEPGPGITGAAIMACLSEADRARVEQAQQAAIERALPYELELQITAADGQRKWVHAIGLPILEHGRVVRLEGAVQDITGRKRAEAQARQGEIVLDSVFQALPDLFFVLAADGAIRDCRAQSAADLYMPPEAMVGRRMQDVLPPAAAALFAASLAKVQGQGGMATYEYAVDLPRGRRQFEARLSQLPASGHLIAVVRDITERVEAAALVEKQRRLLADSQHIAHIGSWEVDLATGILGWTAETYRIYGVSPESFVPSPEAFLRLVHPEDRPAVAQLSARILAGGAPSDLEFRVCRPDGEVRVIRGRGVPIFGADKQPVRALGTVQDITEYKRVERALHDNELRLRLALEAANQGLYDLDLRTGKAIVSPEYARMLGYAPDTFQETHAAWRARLHPDDQARVCQVYDDYIAGRIAEFRVEFRQCTRQGDWRWILSLGKVQERDAHGRPVRMLGTHTDIDSIKQVEVALAEKSRELIESEAQAEMGHWWLDGATGEAYWADEIYRILDLAPDVAAGPVTLRERVHPDDWPTLDESLRCALSSSRDHNMEYRIVRPDGAVRHVRCRGRRAVQAETGEYRLVGTFQDITVLRETQRALERVRDELEQRVQQRTAELAATNQELQAFTYSVSHDLKAPLRGIDGYSRLLQEDYQAQLDDEGRLFLRNIRRGAEQMGQLIDDLLAYSRMERCNIQGQHLNLGELVDRALDERKADILARDMIVEVATDNVQIRADADGVIVVLRNLIDNAIKFTCDCQAPRLSIRASTRANSAILEIADNGIGFDMQFSARIFEIFQRLQRAEEYPGTGIGLAIVRKAMQRMGGRVWVESLPGQGTTFYLEFPR